MDSTVIPRSFNNSAAATHSFVLPLCDKNTATSPFLTRPKSP